MRQPSWPIVLALSLGLAACGAPAQPAGPAAVPAASAGATAGGAPPPADPAAPRPGLTSAGAPAKIRIAYVTPAPNVLPAVWLATDYGLSDTYGLDAALTYSAGA